MATRMFAWTEGQTAVREILRRFLRLQRDGANANGLPVAGFRGLQSVPVRLLRKIELA